MTKIDGLTRREFAVACAIAEGKVYKEVADQLGITAKTVDSHLSSVRRKLKLRGAADITRWAIGRGHVRNEFATG